MGSKGGKKKGYGKKKKGRPRGLMGNSDELFLLAQADTAATAHARQQQQQQNIPEPLDLSRYLYDTPRSPAFPFLNTLTFTSSSRHFPNPTDRLMYSDFLKGDELREARTQARRAAERQQGQEGDEGGVGTAKKRPSPDCKITASSSVMMWRLSWIDTDVAPKDFLDQGRQPPPILKLRKTEDHVKQDLEVNKTIPEPLNGTENEVHHQAPPKYAICHGCATQSGSKVHLHPETDNIHDSHAQPTQSGAKVHFDPAAIIRSRAHPTLSKSKDATKLPKMSDNESGTSDATMTSWKSQDDKAFNQATNEFTVTQPGDSKDNSSFGNEFDDRVRTFFGRRDEPKEEKKAATVAGPSSPSQSSSKWNISLPNTTIDSFPQWSDLPETIRARILSFLICTPAEYHPTYGQYSVHRVMKPKSPQVYSPVPLDFILGPGNKTFAQAGLQAFYSGHTFHLDKPRESLFFLKQIGEHNLKNLNHLTITLSHGLEKESAINAGGNAPQEKLWVNVLNYLVKHTSMTGFADFTITFTQLGERQHPSCYVVPGTRMTADDDDDPDPLHDFSDNVFRFGPTMYLYPTNIVNDIIRALVKIRGVKRPCVMLGTMAGAHWDAALTHTMGLPAVVGGEESESDPIVMAIRAAWRARVEMEEAGLTGVLRRFKLD